MTTSSRRSAVWLRAVRSLTIVFGGAAALLAIAPRSEARPSFHLEMKNRRLTLHATGASLVDVLGALGCATDGAASDGGPARPAVASPASKGSEIPAATGCGRRLVLQGADDSPVTISLEKASLAEALHRMLAPRSYVAVIGPDDALRSIRISPRAEHSASELPGRAIRAEASRAVAPQAVGRSAGGRPERDSSDEWAFWDEDTRRGVVDLAAHGDDPAVRRMAAMDFLARVGVDPAQREEALAVMETLSPEQRSSWMRGLQLEADETGSAYLPAGFADDLVREEDDAS